MDIAVRPATPDDGDRIAAMRADAIAEQAEGRGGSIWSRREALRRPGDGGATFVGTIDDAVVGFADVDTEMIEGGDLLGIVSAVYVDPGARGVAVGETILDEVIAWCTARGCVGIDSHALPGNRDTKNFFETFGFTARLLVVHRKLR